MPPIPRLSPVPPTQGQPIAVDRSPFWIGSGSGAALRVHLPTVAERHASITEREDGFYLSPYPGASPIRSGGREITGPTRLQDGSIIELSPAARWEFVSGEPRVAPRPVEVDDEPPAEVPVARRRWALPRRRRRATRAGFPLWAVAALVLIVGALGFGGYYLVRTITAGPDEAQAPPLTPEEGQLYDQLMAEATRSIERGSMLLDLGLEDEALGQFTQAISSFETSLLSRNEWVRPSIEALVDAVRKIYQENRGRVPAGLRAVRGPAADLTRVMSAALGVDEFARGVEAVRGAFRQQFARDIVITGQDHAEHLSLYGPGGALDIRVRDLSADQIGFLIERFKSVGIRVKDFSRDEVLQAQIRAARARGWSDRAGTGLHLHIDRFRDRRDRWTV